MCDAVAEIVEEKPQSRKSSVRNSFHDRNLDLLAALTAARKARDAEQARTKTRLQIAVKRLQKKVLAGISDLPRSRPAAGSGPTEKKESPLEEWKRKNKVPATSRVFIIKGGYLDLKRGLERRGWTENRESESPLFDLKWTLNAKDIDYDKLTDRQMVNHFVKNREITTKIGLTKNLKATEHEHFFPRSFDLSDYNERLEFTHLFKLNKAWAILKIFKSHFEGSAQLTYSLKVVTTAMTVVKRSLVDVDDALDIPSLAETIGRTSDSEWKILRFVSLVAPDEVTDDGENLPGEADRGNRSPNKRATIPPKLGASDFSASLAEYDSTSILDQVASLLRVAQGKDPQYELSGMRNMWIVKPAGKSRGRGIELKRNLLEIAHALTSGPEGELLVVQKYIENPQIIEGYKFDIRQWVLVTDWNPLTIYIWQQPYIRFASQKFDEEAWHKQHSSSLYMHLVNNSVNKNNPHFHEMNAALNTDDYMWFRQDYQHWLHRQFCCSQVSPLVTPPPYTSESMHFDLNAALQGDYGGDFHRPAPPSVPASDAGCTDIWTDKIAPQIEDIVLQSLLCVMDTIEHRKGSCEIYGYDFMVSQDNKVWLIEVNSSPAMDYSTHVTAPLIKLVLDDTAAILDAAPAAPKLPTEWRLAYKGPTMQAVSVPGHSLRLQVDGTGLRRPTPTNLLVLKPPLSGGH